MCLKARIVLTFRTYSHFSLTLFFPCTGTLRAAKRKKIIDFEGEFLLKGVHDDVDVIVL